MATLRSLYSDAVTAHVPTDTLHPDPPVLGEIQCYQDTNTGAVPLGRSVVTINWTAPTKNALLAEYLGLATGASQQVETSFDPIESGYQVYEASGFGGSGFGDTTITQAVEDGDNFLIVADATNFAVGNWVQIKEGATEEFAKIASIDGLTLWIEQCVVYEYTTSATVKEVNTMTLKTLTTDYTIVTSTGVLTLVAGQWTNGKSIVVNYQATLQDLAGFVLYRLPSGSILTDKTFSNVTSQPGAVLVSSTIPDTDTQYIETLAAGDNGENWTYYLFAKDDETIPNYSLADGVLVETITSIPQNLTSTVGDAKVILTWDAAPGGADANQDGWNVYRNNGGSLVPGSLVKANSAVIVKGTTTFDDSADNITNRVSSGTLAYPANGSTYTYVVESEDTTTAWTTGTRNQDSGGAAQLTAVKTA